MVTLVSNKNSNVLKTKPRVVNFKTIFNTVVDVMISKKVTEMAKRP